MNWRLATSLVKTPTPQALVDGWKARVAAVAAAVHAKGITRVFVYDSGTDQPFTAGKFAMPTALIDAAGGRNVLDDRAMSWGTTSWEDVAVRDPPIPGPTRLPRKAPATAPCSTFSARIPRCGINEAVKQGRFLALRYEQLTPRTWQH